MRTNSNQQSLFDTSPDITTWHADFKIIDIEKLDDSSVKHVPCILHAEITNDKLYMECGCSQSKKEHHLCDHVVRAFAGDSNLLDDKKSQLEDFLKLYEIGLTTDFYFDFCDIYDMKENYTAEKNEKLHRAIFLKSSVLIGQLNGTGFPLGVHTKQDSLLRLLDSLMKDNSKRGIWLPLFNPDAPERSGWAITPRPIFASIMGINDVERHKEKKLYMARVQSIGTFFERGDVLYPVQIDSAINGDFGNKVLQIIKFTVYNKNGQAEKHEMGTENFIRYLITGVANE